ncbi:hypothetical protein RFI_11557 [Reticulomyxa filosa]|uniref:ER membrane protein complex subunit 7 beta-sandwich domain-containing protein n=1 Tax=Reticulomyxa filosa TaxID=46433 RepID=X6NGY6_RETFI|nr:hypothetical protein RFI_11557 [Reticulomyxa filosa]|eukprot:ETO25580.1 hypothetical protein RFI_11557 [Reticulomyxa filosa]
MLACLHIIFNPLRKQGKDFRIDGRIAGVERELFAKARVSLDGNRQIAIPTVEGKFALFVTIFFFLKCVYQNIKKNPSSDVSIGKHRLEVHLSGYVWNVFSVDMESNGKAKIFKLQNNERQPPQLIVTPIQPAIYIKPPQSYDPLQIVKSPMGFMMAMMLFMSLVMPKMLKSVQGKLCMQISFQHFNVAIFLMLLLFLCLCWPNDSKSLEQQAEMAAEQRAKKVLERSGAPANAQGTNGKTAAKPKK